MENPEEVGGIFCYKEKPSGIRIAKSDDFFHAGRKRLGMWYLIHSFYYDEFQAYQVNERFKIENIQPWLIENRVYVKE